MYRRWLDCNYLRRRRKREHVCSCDIPSQYEYKPRKKRTANNLCRVHVSYFANDYCRRSLLETLHMTSIRIMVCSMSSITIVLHRCNGLNNFLHPQKWVGYKLDKQDDIANTHSSLHLWNWIRGRNLIVSSQDHFFQRDRDNLAEEIFVLQQ